MKRILFYIFGFIAISAGYFVYPSPVQAEVCWTQRVINQHRCTSNNPLQNGCIRWRAQAIYNGGCSAESTSGSGAAKSSCESACSGPYAGDACYGAYCVDYGPTTTPYYTCEVENFVASCNPEPACNAIGNIVNCNVNYNGSACTNNSQTLTYGCWGPGNPTGIPGNCGNGVCGSGETCSNCAADCGACCGNGNCGGTESCSTCAADCGSCPPTCGNGSCEGTESCSTCSQDCGSCWQTPTPTNPPANTPTPWCGNGSCSSGENCTNCAVDCGNCPVDTPTPTPTPAVGQCSAPAPRDPPTSQCAACPSCNGNITWSWDTVAGALEYELAILDSSNALVVDFGWQSAATYDCDSDSICSYTTPLPPGTYKSRLRARGSCTISSFSYSNEYTLNVCSGTISAIGKEIDSTATSCDDVNLSTDYVSPITFDLSPSVLPGSQIQTGSDYVTWTDVNPGTYTLSVSPPSGYVVKFMCWQRSFTSPLTGDGPSASLVNGESLTWYGIGLSLGTPWVQTEGGDVLVATNIQAHLADTVVPREFNTAGAAGGYPGVVSYGTSYDFNPLSTDTGSDLVSANGWLVRESGLPIYSKDWYNTFAQKYDLSGNSQSYTGPAKPASSAVPYYVNGNTSVGNWAVGNGENIVLFVNGDLSITDTITTSGSGFVAFIVSGDISVDSTVGVAYTSNVPSIEGLYVTNGTFSTGTSQLGVQRLVTHGTFIANAFQLQRDLATSGTGQNHTTSAELFTYDPQLMFNMPDEFRDIRLKWEETAP